MLCINTSKKWSPPPGWRRGIHHTRGVKSVWRFIWSQWFLFLFLFDILPCWRIPLGHSRRQRFLRATAERNAEHCFTTLIDLLSCSLNSWPLVLFSSASWNKLPPSSIWQTFKYLRMTLILPLSFHFHFLSPSTFPYKTWLSNVFPFWLPSSRHVPACGRPLFCGVCQLLFLLNIVLLGLGTCIHARLTHMPCHVEAQTLCINCRR